MTLPSASEIMTALREHPTGDPVLTHIRLLGVWHQDAAMVGLEDGTAAAAAADDVRVRILKTIAEALHVPGIEDALDDIAATYALMLEAQDAGTPIEDNKLSVAIGAYQVLVADENRRLRLAEVRP